MMLEDYIKMLQRKLDNYGNVEVTITQEGHYCGGEFAELYDEARLENLNLGGKGIGWTADGKYHCTPDDFRKMLVLGHSEQYV